MNFTKLPLLVLLLPGVSSAQVGPDPDCTYEDAQQLAESYPAGRIECRLPLAWNGSHFFFCEDDVFAAHIAWIGETSVYTVEQFAAELALGQDHVYITKDVHPDADDEQPPLTQTPIYAVDESVWGAPMWAAGRYFIGKLPVGGHKVVTLMTTSEGVFTSTVRVTILPHERAHGPYRHAAQ